MKDTSSKLSRSAQRDSKELKDEIDPSNQAKEVSGRVGEGLEP